MVFNLILIIILIILGIFIIKYYNKDNDSPNEYDIIEKNIELKTKNRAIEEKKKFI